MDAFKYTLLSYTFYNINYVAWCEWYPITGWMDLLFTQQCQVGDTEPSGGLVDS